jgi:hypothetical protein
MREISQLALWAAFIAAMYNLQTLAIVFAVPASLWALLQLVHYFRQRAQERQPRGQDDLDRRCYAWFVAHPLIAPTFEQLSTEFGRTTYEMIDCLNRLTEAQKITRQGSTFQLNRHGIPP